MGFFEDFKPVFTKHKLTFVEKKQEAGNIMSFIFKADNPVFWKAGQHGIFFFSRKMKGGSWKGFSIASYPDEAEIRISTRILKNPSEYKKALKDLVPKDQINMRGPFGPFYLKDDRTPVVFIAGGIGITPFRSLILHSLQNKDTAPSSIRLLYSDSGKDYAYKHEFDEITSSNNIVKIKYLTSSNLPTEITKCVHDFGNKAIYYISGSGKMIKSLKNNLIEQGISKKNIKHEMFFGLQK